MIGFLGRMFFGEKKYKNHKEAVVITCYYNPKNSQARLDAFNKFYDTIKHLNHRIIECIIEDENGAGKSQLPKSPYITQLRTNSNLWHKEQLLNKIVRDLPWEYKYVLWVDADVLFTNKNWVVDAVEELQVYQLVQLFEYSIHLEKGETEPSFDVAKAKKRVNERYDGRRLWRSYAANWESRSNNIDSPHYDVRGHVGLAWAARRASLQRYPLYERTLIGGADGIIAYGGTGQLSTVTEMKDMFQDSWDDVTKWASGWYREIGGRVGYVSGDLYHIWHGDLKDRQYYSRIKEFGPHMKGIQQKDDNGLYTPVDPKAKQYMDGYFDKREGVKTAPPKPSPASFVSKSSYGSSRYGSSTHNINHRDDFYDNSDDGLAKSVLLGYATNDGVTGGLLGGNLLGGMVGDALNTSDDKPSETGHHHNANCHHDNSTTQPSDNATDNYS